MERDFESPLLEFENPLEIARIFTSGATYLGYAVTLDRPHGLRRFQTNVVEKRIDPCHGLDGVQIRIIKDGEGKLFPIRPWNLGRHGPYRDGENWAVGRARIQHPPFQNRRARRWEGIVNSLLRRKLGKPRTRLLIVLPA